MICLSLGKSNYTYVDPMINSQSIIKNATFLSEYTLGLKYLFLING